MSRLTVRGFLLPTDLKTQILQVVMDVGGEPHVRAYRPVRSVQAILLSLWSSWPGLYAVV